MPSFQTEGRGEMSRGRTGTIQQPAQGKHTQEHTMPRPRVDARYTFSSDYSDQVRHTVSS